MTSRRKRFDKLIEHRARELDHRVSALAETRTQELAAEQSAERERTAHFRAEQDRRDKLARPLDAKSFVETNDFLVSCARKRDLAEQQLLRARRAVQTAQGEVQAARNNLKKVELVKERLATEERVQASRMEQRATDEFVTLRQAESNKRRSSP